MENYTLKHFSNYKKYKWIITDKKRKMIELLIIFTGIYSVTYSNLTMKKKKYKIIMSNTLY